MKLIHSILISLILVLAGCASPDLQVKYYLLPYQAINNQLKADIDLQVNLAEYLKQDSIVVENNASELTFANNHRWAEPLEQLTSRYLNKALLLAGNAKFTSDKKLVINIERLYGSASGQVYLSGFWQAYSETSPHTQRYYFDFKLKQSESGYKSLVDTSAVLLSQLASQINQNM